MDVVARLWAVNWTVWLFWVLFFFAVRVLHKSGDPEYGLRTLVIGETGHVDLHKVIAFGGFLASLWAFIHYADGRIMAEWMFTLFFGGCVAPRLLGKLMELKRGPLNSPPGGSPGNQ